MKLKSACFLEESYDKQDITLPTNVCIAKTMVFQAVMYESESWTIKKAKHRRIDAFELWCWRRLLRVPWTAKRSNQSVLKEINPEYWCWCWSWSSNNLATWWEQPTHWKRPCCCEKTEGRRRRRWQRIRWLDGITDSMDMSLSEHQELVLDREAWHAVIHGVTKSRTRLSNWNELNWTEYERQAHGQQMWSHVFSRSVMSDSWRPHRLQHTRLPCSSLTPRFCSNSCPLSYQCYLTISSSAAHFFCLQSFPASGSFPISRLFTSDGQ